MNLKVGDVVKLKSGGPLMTINRVKDDEVICEWFNQEGHTFDPKWHGFKPDMLKVVHQSA